MKKVKQRKGMVALMALAAVLLCFGGHLVWVGITHVGPGVWMYGGEDFTGHAEDEHAEVIPQTEYRRQCFVSGTFTLLVAGAILWPVVKAWKEQNELEISWERTVSNPDSLQEVHKHPELYRDDFKKWINENHPNLKIWNPPPNSSN